MDAEFRRLFIEMLGQMTEQGKQIAAQNEKLVEQGKSIKKALKQLGNIQQNQGMLVESLVGKNMIKFMTDSDKGTFEKVIYNLRFDFKESSSDIDNLFVFSKAIVLVDVKSLYRGRDLDKWCAELLPSLLVDKDFQGLVRGRKIYVGIAGLRFKSGVVERASDLGYYAFRLLNENAKLLNGEGFEARAVG